MSPKFDPRGQINSFYIFVGPSGAGKTTAMVNILINSKYCLKKPINKVVLVARHLEQSGYAPLFKKISQVTVLSIENGISEEKLIQAVKGKSNCAVIFDDVETEKQTPGLLELICSCAVRLCHHIGFTTFLSTHSIFYNNDHYRLLQKSAFFQISTSSPIYNKFFCRNAQYLIFLQQRRELNSISNLSRQVFSSDRLEKAFRNICARKKSFNFLILDLLPRTPDRFLVRESFDCRKPIAAFHYA